jgi:multicomponent Na+:H+ antiporter subunit C
MTAYVVPLVLISGSAVARLPAAGAQSDPNVVGLLLIGNAINLVDLTVGGPSGNPPSTADEQRGDHHRDPLAQGMILTCIVITMGIAAFVGADLRRIADDHGEKSDDPEDTRYPVAWGRSALDEDHPPPGPATDLPATRRARLEGCDERQRGAKSGLAHDEQGEQRIAMSAASVLTPLPVLVPMACAR